MNDKYSCLTCVINTRVNVELFVSRTDTLKQTKKYETVCDKHGENKQTEKKRSILELNFNALMIDIDIRMRC